MSDIKDGGPAFPVDVERPWCGESRLVRDGGMSLRDWFAGMALHGLIVADELATGNLARAKCTPHPATAPEIAKAAYETADAMLKERDK